MKTWNWQKVQRGGYNLSMATVLLMAFASGFGYLFHLSGPATMEIFKRVAFGALASALAILFFDLVKLAPYAFPVLQGRRARRVNTEAHPKG